MKSLKHKHACFNLKKKKYLNLILTRFKPELGVCVCISEKYLGQNGQFVF